MSSDLTETLIENGTRKDLTPGRRFRVGAPLWREAEDGAAASPRPRKWHDHSLQAFLARRWKALRPHLKRGWTDFRSFFSGLSGHLLALTAVFVAVMVVIIMVPTLAAYQERWLIDRVRQAEIASLALDASAEGAVSRELSSQLLNSVGASYLALQSGGVQFVLRDPSSTVEPDVIDIRHQERGLSDDLTYLWGPWKTLSGREDRLIRTEAVPKVRKGTDIIEIVVPAQPLKQELREQLGSILRLSLLISLVAGALIFAALSFFVVRPVRQLTRSIARFKENPEDGAAVPQLSGRHDEIGQIEEELFKMQQEVGHALRTRARLAALGQAVSKISHDLRNMLTAAQMASERLAYSGDPNVTKALPRLERALDRALTLAQNVLNYGKTDEIPPRIQILRLKDLSEAAAEDAGLALNARTPDRVRFSLKAEQGFFFEADPDHIHRLLVNLMRNARQAIENQPNRKTVGRVTLSAVKTAEEVILVLSDNGPGIPERVREKLFQPFSTSLTPGGSGLGLAIARELAQTHGGDVKLIDTGPSGTSFEVRIPQKG
ncbi:HAMP domain-containing histidine kinase [Asticcacaulis sp. DW145]|uniref:histidine kinase n=1 Tax=Asticcacaulis currens TaxID=2984210 RepID=A0ABT5IFP6_9CAUL|nr:HAMP domain-containing sensor histidine kinase [Asticcacaulis currens]MDC7694738.1 HAMP domain-containing sensor histidine kinase [Asticcacaulis currens]BEV11164.1 HAMP domain-containing histidine kinase [Asticcacaulis sp. DW145]